MAPELAWYIHRLVQQLRSVTNWTDADYFHAYSTLFAILDSNGKWWARIVLPLPPGVLHWQFAVPDVSSSFDSKPAYVRTVHVV